MLAVMPEESKKFMRENGRIEYAGIGSRRTPPLILGVMEAIGETLAREGWILRSGHAPGADQAFEKGAGEAAEVYLPWPGFEGEVPIYGRPLYQASPTAHAIAADHHPAWPRLKDAVRSLHARNAHQVLGLELDAPSSFVICWTPDGSLDGRGGKSGGTGQALRIAAAYGVPVFNLKNADVERPHSEVMAWISDRCPRPSGLPEHTKWTILPKRQPDTFTANDYKARPETLVEPKTRCTANTIKMVAGKSKVVRCDRSEHPDIQHMAKVGNRTVRWRG